MNIRRGDVLYVDLGIHTNDSIQGGRRPVVVVSNNLNNRFSSVYTVVPLTTKIQEKKKLPTHVYIKSVENYGIEQDSLALCEQVTIISAGSIEDADYGRLNNSVMEAISKALQIQMGIIKE